MGNKRREKCDKKKGRLCTTCGKDRAIHMSNELKWICSSCGHKLMMGSMVEKGKV